MAAIAAEEHDDAEAERVNGEVTVAPLAGLLTEGLAKAVAAERTKDAKAAENVQIFMSAKGPDFIEI